MFLQFKVTAELPEKLTAFQNGFFWWVGVGGGGVVGRNQSNPFLSTGILGIILEPNDPLSLWLDTSSGYELNHCIYVF